MVSTLVPELVLAGRYRLEHQLASGGQGQVWRAADEVLARPVAVKLLRSEHAGNPAFLERFRTEARCAAALPHPGIASVFDYGEIDEPTPAAYLVMELIEGVPLSVLLAREGPLDAERTLDVITQAALALGSAHEAGIVHRDVKPGNLLIRHDGVVKVTDFGIARGAGEASQTETGLVVGTVAYLSPEQVVGFAATPASDVYALGVVAYECLAGRRPFSGEHPVALALAHHRHRPPPLAAHVPEPVRALVERAMAKDPAARPPNAGALAQEARAARAALGNGRPAGAAAHLTTNLPPAELRPHQRAGPIAAARAARPAGPGTLGNGGAAPATGLGQDTGEWTPVSLLLVQAWFWSKRQRPLAVAALVTMLALIGAAITAASWKPAPDVVMPSLMGRPAAEAERALAGAGLQVRERTRPDRTARAGVVLAQDPSAGTRLAPGGMVTLIVSSGPASSAQRPVAPATGEGGSATPAEAPATTAEAPKDQQGLDGKGPGQSAHEHAKKGPHGDQQPGNGRHDDS
jgi:eukaryotic-like serine/threonine-protein kinase